MNASVLASSGQRQMNGHDAALTARAPTPEAAFRLHLSSLPSASVGPGSYAPRHALTERSAARADFGQAERFLPSKVSYISPRHNSDLLCTASPGPKYNVVPTAATYPRQPTVSWGDKSAALAREEKASFLRGDGNDVGPAAYTPRVANIKPAAARCAFSRSPRFGGPFGSYQVLNNSSLPGAATQATLLQPSLDAVTPASPRFSFGPSRARGEPVEVRHKPRTSFMTHSIRGGLAKPATLECNVGPGDYAPRTGDIGESLAPFHSSSGGHHPHGGMLSSRVPGPGFGSSSRFLKAGLQYLSAEHAKANVGQVGPGPKYVVQLHNTAYGAKTARTSGLRWIP